MKYFFLLFSLVISFKSFAQIKEPNALKAGFGISRFIEEKVNTPTLLVAFNKDFYPNTFVEISAEWAMPVDISIEEELRELSSYRFSMNLLYKVLDEPNQAFNAGVGFSAGFYGLDYTILSTGEQNYTIEFNPGFLALLEYNYILPSQWFLGARASISRYDANRSSWMLGAVLGLRF